MTDVALPIAKPTPLTSTDVCAAIQAHFGAGGGQYAVLFEVRNGTAWRANRSVDAVVMSLWPSLGMELWGMEIKVSRSDWRRELREPGKASEVFGYFDRWFLVAPQDVVATGEIPEPWGWFVPEGGRLRKMRDAAKNDAVKPADRHFLGALLRRVAQTDDVFVQRRIDDALKEQRRVFDAEVDRRALQRQGDLKKEAEAWTKIHDMLKRQPDDYIFQDDVIAALRVVMKVGVHRTYDSLRSLVDEVGRMKEKLDGIADELAIEKKTRGRRK